MINRRNKPTLKQRKFVHEYLKTGNITTSALNNYNIDKSNKHAKDVAHKLGYTILHKPSIINYISQVLNNTGLSDEKLSESLAKVIDSGLTKEALTKAQPSDSLRGIEMAFRLKDSFPIERKTISKLEIRTQLESKSIDELKQELNKALEEANRFKDML